VSGFPCISQRFHLKSLKTLPLILRSSHAKVAKAQDPAKLEDFRQKTAGLIWQPEELIASLSTLFDAVDDLAVSEVKYYYNRRWWSSVLSTCSRLLAWLLGTLGLVAPLIATATNVPNLTNWGFVLLALSAGLLGLNALFGGTSGHIRFVSAQLKLEQAVTLSRVEWQKHKQKLFENRGDQKCIDEAFAAIRTYSETAYGTSVAETQNWASEVTASIDRLSASVNQRSEGSQ
jgi:hypothetical protein